MRVLGGVDKSEWGVRRIKNKKININKYNIVGEGPCDGKPVGCGPATKMEKKKKKMEIKKIYKKKKKKYRMDRGWCVRRGNKQN